MKSFMIFKITIIVFIFMLITSPVHAQRVYFWTDEKGIRNATTIPPPDNVIEYKTDSFGKKDTKQEIEQYQRQVEQKRKVAEALLEARKRANRAEEATRKDQEIANDQAKRERRAEEGRIAVEKATRDAKIEYLEKAYKNPTGDPFQRVRQANEKIDKVRDQYWQGE